jgi:hypothetical protein
MQKCTILDSLLTYFPHLSSCDMLTLQICSRVWNHHVPCFVLLPQNAHWRVLALWRCVTHGEECLVCAICGLPALLPRQPTNSADNFMIHWDCGQFLWTDPLHTSIQLLCLPSSVFPYISLQLFGKSVQSAHTNAGGATLCSNKCSGLGKRPEGWGWGGGLE